MAKLKKKERELCLYAYTHSFSNTGEEIKGRKKLAGKKIFY